LANGKLKVQAFPANRADDAVVAWENTALFSSADFPRYNPDSLVQRHGLRIYQKMMIDEQVKAAVTFKRDAVTSRDWVLDWPTDSKLSDAEKQKRAAMLTRMLNSMKGALVDKLNAILSGLTYGYSITEKAYGLFEFEGRPQSGIVALLPKDCSTFWFYTDDYGQLIDFKQKVSGKEQSLDLGKFVHYVHAPEEDEWYGTSELRAAYRSYYAKDLLIKYWLIWGERAAGGFVKATRTAEAQVQPNTPAWDKLQTALSQIKTVGSILLPVGIDLEMIQPPSGDGFEKAIQFHDLAIAKSMLVPNLLGVSVAGQTGAYAQSQTQLEAFFWTLNATSRRLSSVMTEQVLKDAGEALFPDGRVPEFCFKPASLEHVKWIVTAWSDLVGKKAVTTTPEDEERLRQILEMPAKTPEEIQAAQDEAHAKAIEVAAKGNPFGQGQKPQSPQDKAKAAATYSRATFEFDESKHPRDERGRFGESGTDSGVLTEIAGHIDSMHAFAERTAGDVSKVPTEAASKVAGILTGLHDRLSGGELSPKEIANVLQQAGDDVWNVGSKPGDGIWNSGSANVGPRLESDISGISHMLWKSAKEVGRRKAGLSKRASFSRAVQRVNFAVIAAREESILQRTVPSAADVIARGVKKATGATDVSEYTDANVAQIADVALDGPTIGKLRSVFVDALRTSWDVGSSMAKNELERARGGHFTSRAQLEALRDRAAEFLSANGFRMAGNASDATKAIIQQELLSAVKNGMSPKQTRANIWDRLVSKGILTRGAVQAVETDAAVNAVLDALWVDTVEGAAAYLNTLVRTNTFEAMNEARYQEFTDPALGDFVVALRYSAILDDRTTEICSALSDATWATDSEMWDTYRPPNHYNCRSLLVPITAVDGWDGQESPDPGVQPQDGFGGGAQ
jgi:SPP1 gp7 family putative phage head morphogenesis protein